MYPGFVNYNFKKLHIFWNYFILSIIYYQKRKFISAVEYKLQDTAGNRGYGILAARDLLLDAEYELARA